MTQKIHFVAKVNVKIVFLPLSFKSVAMRSTSWRGGESEQGGGFSSESGGPPRLERSKSTQGSLPSRDDSSGHPGLNRRFGANASWDEDNLPEWAMDDPIEGGGSFDATGAFLDDRNLGERGKASDATRTNANLDKDDQKTESISDTKTKLGISDKDNPLKKVLESVRTNEKTELKSASDDGKPSEPSQKQENRAKDKELKSNETVEKDINDERSILNNHKHHQQQPQQQQPQQQPQAHPQQQVPSYKSTSKYGGSEARDSTPAVGSSASERVNTLPDPTPIDRLQEVAEDIEKLIMDDDQSCNEIDEALSASHLHGRDAHKHPSADEVLADKTKEIDRWFYLDPQGKVQGPFTATEMLEWYRAGYFDETLNVRRVVDRDFIELGDLLKACSGSIPFISMPPPIIPSSLLQSQATEINLSTAPNVKPATPTKPLTNPLVHTSKMPPPTSANNPPYFDILHQTPNFLGLMNQPANDFRKCSSNQNDSRAISLFPPPTRSQTLLFNIKLISPYFISFSFIEFTA